MRALVVDDSAVMRKVMIGALARAGISAVEQAADGREAVEAVLSGNYDLVLMDWNMPRLAGIDALKEIRAGGRDVPVIIVTTEAERSRVIEALRAGANNYIIKPFSPEAVVLKIQETLARAA